MTTKLNDLQLVLLSEAANREDGNLLPIPKSISADDNRVKAAIASLVRRKLAARVGDHVMITDAGRAAIGVEDDSPGAEIVADGNSPETPAPAALPSARTGTKAALLVELLSRDGGATLDDLTSVTGWLPHTVRAALTGLRKKGRSISSEKVDGVRVWRIVEK
ncbi:DUF3489 domain-containing protein [Nitratireductor sp. GCM10026969]|uniref:DUF3489 domain-containing protein n=1 Tax=Nitratireductor sp. GCM10026969 TaxID=3252645 RepID=UPI00361B7E0E